MRKQTITKLEISKSMILKKNDLTKVKGGGGTDTDIIIVEDFGG